MVVYTATYQTNQADAASNTAGTDRSGVHSDTLMENAHMSSVASIGVIVAGRHVHSQEVSPHAAHFERTLASSTFDLAG